MMLPQNQLLVPILKLLQPTDTDLQAPMLKVTNQDLAAETSEETIVHLDAKVKCKSVPPAPFKQMVKGEHTHQPIAIGQHLQYLSLVYIWEFQEVIGDMSL